MNFKFMLSKRLKKIPSDIINELDQLKEFFKNDLWAVNYINTQSPRIYDDIQKIKKQYINSQKSKLKILNIGSVPYIFEIIARKEGFESITSVDLSPNRYLNVINHYNLEVKKLDIEDCELRKQFDFSSYDLVVMAEVFEHFRIDLIALFNDIHKMCNNNCQFYLTTPNFYAFRKIIKNIFTFKSGPDLFENWNKLHTIGHMGHVREYSKNEIIIFLEKLNFEIIKYYSRSRFKISNNAINFFPSIISIIMETLFPNFSSDVVIFFKKINK